MKKTMKMALAMAAAAVLANGAAGASWVVRSGGYSGMALDTRSVKAVGSGGATVPYWTEGGAKVVVAVDGEALISATNSGEFGWAPLAAGERTLTHTAGGEVWTARVMVESAGGDAGPNPPESAKEGMALGAAEAEFGPEGGSYGIRTRATGGEAVEWEATASAEWITIEGAASGTAGRENVRYSVEANGRADARVGYVYVGGHVHTVRQSGVALARMEEGAAWEKDGGAGEFAVEAGDGVEWNAVAGAEWIWVKRGAGSGSGTVEYEVAPWFEPRVRRRSIRVGEYAFEVVQRGKMVELDRAKVECGELGGEVSIGVTAEAGIGWGADTIEKPEWVEIAGEGAMSGTGRLVLRVEENPGLEARSGTVNVNGELVRIEQGGRIELEYGNITCGPGWGEYTLRVTAAASTQWRAVSSDSHYIELAAGEGCELGDDGTVAGCGSGTVKFYMDEMEDASVPWSGWISVGDRVAWVTQKAEGTYALPELGAGAGEREVGAALGDAADEGLKANVRTVEEYGRLLEWAEKNGVGAKELKESGVAWLSHALDLEGLAAGAPEALRVEGIAAAGAGGAFEIVVGVEGVAVGDGARAENLARVFGVEGAEELGGTFSAEKVEVETIGAEGGKVRVRFAPKGGGAGAGAGSFFARVLLVVSY